MAQNANPGNLGNPNLPPGVINLQRPALAARSRPPVVQSEPCCVGCAKDISITLDVDCIFNTNSSTCTECVRKHAVCNEIPPESRALFNRLLAHAHFMDNTYGNPLPALNNPNNPPGFAADRTQLRNLQREFTSKVNARITRNNRGIPPKKSTEARQTFLQTQRLEKVLEGILDVKRYEVRYSY